MDAEDSSLPQATGKIRVRAGHGGRNRGKPYARKSKATKKEDRDDNNEQVIRLGDSKLFSIPETARRWVFTILSIDIWLFEREVCMQTHTA